jgi:hypothetical protein
LAKLGLKPGEWTYASKLTIKALMRPNWPLKARIWACLMLQTFGYESDLAVIMRRYPGAKPEISPLLAHEIIAMLDRATAAACKESAVAIDDETRLAIRISRQHMRRALAEMEDDGLLIRVFALRPLAQLRGLSLNEILDQKLGIALTDLPPARRKQLHSGRNLVYLHARPKPAKDLELLVAKNGYQDAAQSSEGPIQLLFAFMRKNNLSKLLARAAELAPREDIQQALAAYKAGLDQVNANFREFLLKALDSAEPLPGRPELAPPLQPTLFPAPELAVPESPAGAAPRPGRVHASRAAAGPLSAAVNSTGPGEVPEMKPPSHPPPHSPAATAAAPLSPVEVHIVLDAMRAFSDPDYAAAQRLILACREKMPACTAVLVAEAVRQKGPLAKTNPVGFFLTAVPLLFHQEAWDAKIAADQAIRADIEAGKYGRLNDIVGNPRRFDRRVVEVAFQMYEARNKPAQSEQACEDSAPPRAASGGAS